MGGVFVAAAFRSNRIPDWTEAAFKAGQIDAMTHFFMGASEWAWWKCAACGAMNEYRLKEAPEPEPKCLSCEGCEPEMRPLEDGTYAVSLDFDDGEGGYTTVGLRKVD